MGSRQRGPRKIGDVLANVLARRGYAQQETAKELETAWMTVAGVLLAKRSRAAQVKRGVFEVIVRDSATMQELTFKKKQLFRQLADRVPNLKLKDLRFRLGATDS